MSSNRRFSRGPNDNDFSLEQRLVMQLSAAMNQEEDGQEQNSSQQQGAVQQHESEPHHIANHGNDQQASNPLDISSLLGAFGPTLGAAGLQTALGDNSNIATNHPGTSAAVFSGNSNTPHAFNSNDSLNASSIAQAMDRPISSLFNNRDLGGITTDTILASLLSGSTTNASLTQQRGGNDTSLSHLPLGSSNIDAAHHNILAQSSATPNATPSATPNATPNAVPNAVSNAVPNVVLNATPFAQDLGAVQKLVPGPGSGSSNETQLRPGPSRMGTEDLGTYANILGSALQGSPQSNTVHSNTVHSQTAPQNHISDSQSLHGAADETKSRPYDADSRPYDLGSASSFSATSIDPEVSSIQSVLQLLLTGGAKPSDESSASTLSNHQGNHQSSTSGLHENDNAGSSSSTALYPTPSSSSSQNAVTQGSTDYGSLFGLSLGAEDQNLIDSLRNAMNITSQTPEDHSSNMPEDSHSAHGGTELDSAPFASDSLFGRMPASRTGTTSATKSKRSRLPSATDSTSSFSQSSSQTEFNASDPDTLRAIQQALLSALGPSAASTSLAESLTSTYSPTYAGKEPLLPKPPISEVPLAPAPNRIQGSAMSSVTSATAPATTTSLSTAASSSSSSLHDSLKTGSSGPLSLVPSARKISEPRIAKNVLKRPVAKTVKPAEVDKQKQREENAARKRKWREGHQLQIRDHDLRQRIVKRAHELYGEKDSEEKSKWIEQEFSRRRHRRILRAGIHSIVESAKARAAKAQETGDPSLLAFGRSHMGGVAGTLSQQSRQAASSHLSHLFRNSNAALEPQLSSEKVPMPLTPYMLVATPRRPPYKLQLRTQTENVPSISTKATERSTLTERKPTGANEGSPSSSSSPSSFSSEKPAEIVESSADRTNLTTSHEETPSSGSLDNSADGGSQPSSVSAKNDDIQKPINKNEEEGSNAPANDDGDDAGHKLQKSDTKPKTTLEPNHNLFTERPKHRYSLIGDKRLGAPPNLAAMYHKVKGFSHLQYIHKLTEPKKDTPSSNNPQTEAQTVAAIPSTD